MNLFYLKILTLYFTIYNCIEKALKTANLTKEDIDVILLVGGTTRIPLIKTKLKEKFGNKIKNIADPQEAVALGAAVQAGIKSDEISSDAGLVVTDICNYSLGISVLDFYQGTSRSGVFSIIIPKHSKLPCDSTETYSTTTNNQTEIKIEVYQGENPLVKDNLRLAEFLVDGIPRNVAGAENIDVKFIYNLNDILEVEVKIVSTGKIKRVPIQMKNLLSNNNIGIQNKGYTNSPYYSDYKMILDLAEETLNDNNINAQNKKEINSRLNKLKQYLVEENIEKLKEIDSELTNLLFEVKK